MRSILRLGLVFRLVIPLVMSAFIGGCAVDGTLATPPPTAAETAPEPAATPEPTAGPSPPSAQEPAAAPSPTVEAMPTPTTEPSPELSPTPSGPLAVRLERVAGGFTSPIALVDPDDGTGRRFVADQAGLIWVLTADGEVLERPFLDLTDRMVGLNPGYDERGLLGLALHPAYAENGRLYVYYSAPRRPEAPSGYNHTSHLSEFSVSAEDPDLADAASERVLLQVDQPQSNHNGGQLAFGPDGCLYVALGDGGGANDVGLGHPAQGNGQDVTTLLGSILRIDVDGGDPYAIPEDNPFAADDGRDEIYACGFRNPFRFSFDAAGELGLLAADVGQNLYEEVSVVEPGGNYGWNIREGTHCFSPQSPNSPPETCPDVGARGEPLIPPVLEYGHPGLPDGYGISIAGGYVYRGALVPRLQGVYVFGDWSGSLTAESPTLLAGVPSAADGAPWRMETIAVERAPEDAAREFVLSFAQDAERELYVLTTRNSGPAGTTGSIYRLVPATEGG